MGVRVAVAAVLGVVGTLVAAAAASATCGVGTAVRLAPTGPSPATVSVYAGESLTFGRGPGGNSTVEIEASCTVTSLNGTATFHVAPCMFAVPSCVDVEPPDDLPVPYCVTVRLWDVGRFAYRVTGYGAGSGTIAVFPSGYIQAAASVVTFGRSVGLDGAFPAQGCPPPPVTRSPPPEIGVTLLARPFGQASFQPVAATTTRNGVWTELVTPRIETTYRIEFGENGPVDRSEEVVVHVRPRVILRRVGRRTFFTNVAALESYTVTDAAVQRRVRGLWATIETIRLIDHSSARFRLGRFPAGSRIRVVVAPRPGYLTGVSRSIRIGA